MVFATRVLRILSILMDLEVADIWVDGAEEVCGKNVHFYHGLNCRQAVRVRLVSVSSRASLTDHTLWCYGIMHPPQSRVV